MGLNMTNEELDRQIAEKIFGWKFSKNHKHFDGHKSYREDCWLNNKGQVEWIIPRFSTKIEDSWLIVEKFREYNKIFSVTSMYLSDSARWTYSVKVSNTDGTGLDITFSDTAPLTICEAALKCVDVSL